MLPTAPPVPKPRTRFILPTTSEQTVSPKQDLKSVVPKPEDVSESPNGSISACLGCNLPTPLVLTEDKGTNQNSQNAASTSLYPFKEAGLDPAFLEQRSEKDVVPPKPPRDRDSPPGEVATMSPRIAPPPPGKDLPPNDIAREPHIPSGDIVPDPVRTDPSAMHRTPPPRPPPPKVGWNVQGERREESEVDGSRPSTSSPQLDSPEQSQKMSKDSSDSPPTVMAPPLPQRGRGYSPTSPPPMPERRPAAAVQLNSVIPIPPAVDYATSTPKPESTPVVKSVRVIENPIYLSIDDCKERMVPSTSESSGFASIGSPLKVKDPSPDPFSAPIYDDVTSLSSTDEIQPIMRVDRPTSNDLSLFDLKTSVPPPGRLSSVSHNPYTPPPRRSDFTTVSDILDLDLTVNSLNDLDPTPIELVADPADSQPADGEMEADGTAVSFFGFVSIHVGKKERKRAHARLRHMHLAFHDEEESSDYLLGPFHLADCQLICRQGNSMFIRLNEMEHQKTVSFTPEDNSIDTWSLLLGECWLSQFNLLRNSISGMSSCGTVWLRQGSAAEWQSAATCLVGRSLHYVIMNAADYIYELDLRKVLGIREKVEKDQWCKQVKKKGHRGPFMLTLEGCSMYLECEDEWCTSKWFQSVDEILTTPPHTLDEYRLTGDNVPILVDKCIRFIAAFGMMSEGIYRRNGKITEAKEIMTRLMEDPCGTHLVPTTDETVYAVADVLRQFFRRLDKPLFPHESHARLFEIVNAKMEAAARWSQLRSVLQSMNIVHYSTLRKLMAHLRIVSNAAQHNRASVENVAKVFGASLFHTDSEGGPCFSDNSNQITVVAVLIAAYDDIFDVTTREELSRDMVEEARKHRTPKNRAEGLLIPIHLWERENRPFNVKTDLAAEEVCREAVAKRGFDAPINGKYAIFEVIRGGSLSRVLLPSERLSQVVINRWIPWKCLDGYLLFDHDNREDREDMCSFSGKVKVAEPGSKTFKSLELRIEGGTKVVAFKGEKVQKEWDVDSTIWYNGAEPARKAPYPHNLTFLLKEGTSFNEKFIGFCVSFKQAFDRTSFLNRVLYVQTGGQPTPLVHI